MARLARSDRAGGLHWIHSRGEDNEFPLEGLEQETALAITEAAQRSGWGELARLVAADGYCLVIRSSRPNLSRAMTALQRDLARRRQLFFPERAGELFRDRYQSWLLEEDDPAALERLLGQIRDGALDAAIRASKKLRLQPVTEHSDHADAEVELAEALSSYAIGWYGLSEDEIVTLANSADCKCVIAAFIRSRCAIPVAWIADRLVMGHASAASRGILKVTESNRELELELARLQLARDIEETS